MQAQLIKLPDVERLSRLVIRILGGNPGKFTLQGTNTYLIGTGPKRLLIDTGEGKPSWSEHISSVLSSEAATISQALLTHWHPDHVGGVTSLLQHCPNAKIHKHHPSPGQLDITNGQIFRTEGATVRAFYSPGHTTDHMVFILEEEDAMFTGDNVLGYGTAVFEDLALYLHSLHQMKLQFRGRAYPGHGPVIPDGPAKIEEYIAHRQRREDEVLEVLAHGPRTPREIVEIVYRDVPPELHDAAEKGVLLILKKLELEGRVVRSGEGGRWELVK